MKMKRITALLLCLVLLSATAFASDYTYGTGERYTAEDILTRFAKLIGGSAASYDEDYFDDSGDGGFVYISADAFVLGSDYIIYPMKVEIRPGDTAASVFMRAMNMNGVYGEYDGSETDGFYLKSLGGADFTPNIEPELEAWLDGLVTYYEPESWSRGTLGQFDITDMSGWMFFQNGEMPQVGMSGCSVSDGDVISVRFTLAYGMDLGGDVFGDCDAPYVENVNRDEITKAIADGRLNYMDCVGILNRAGATQEEIDGLLHDI